MQEDEFGCCFSLLLRIFFFFPISHSSEPFHTGKFMDKVSSVVCGSFQVLCVRMQILSFIITTLTVKINYGS